MLSLVALLIATHGPPALRGAARINPKYGVRRARSQWPIKRLRTRALRGDQRPFGIKSLDKPRAVRSETQNQATVQTLHRAIEGKLAIARSLADAEEQ